MVKKCPKCNWDVVGGLCVRCLWPKVPTTNPEALRLYAKLARWDYWHAKFSKPRSGDESP